MQAGALSDARRPGRPCPAPAACRPRCPAAPALAPGGTGWSPRPGARRLPPAQVCRPGPLPGGPGPWPAPDGRCLPAVARCRALVPGFGGGRLPPPQPGDPAMAVRRDRAAFEGVTVKPGGLLTGPGCHVSLRVRRRSPDRRGAGAGTRRWGGALMPGAGTTCAVDAEAGFRGTGRAQKLLGVCATPGGRTGGDSRPGRSHPQADGPWGAGPEAVPDLGRPRGARRRAIASLRAAPAWRQRGAGRPARAPAPVTWRGGRTPPPPPGAAPAAPGPSRRPRPSRRTRPGTGPAPESGRRRGRARAR